MRSGKNLQDLSYKLYPREDIKSSNGDYLEIYWHIYQYGDTKILSGRLDWQDGISIDHSEHIDFVEFIDVMKVASVAIDEARKLIGKKQWEYGHGNGSFEQQYN